MTRKVESLPVSPLVDETEVIGDEEDSDEFNWLDRMHEFMRWQVILPRVAIPFGKPMSDTVLHELSERKDVLIRYAKLRGLIEGDELLTLSGLNHITPQTLVVESEHPNIASLTKRNIFCYFKRRGIFDLIDEELEHAQKTYKEELVRRKRGAHSKKKGH